MPNDLTVSNKAYPKHKWPIVLWLIQVPILTPVIILGILRILQGHPMGAIMWPVWTVSLLWTAGVFGVALMVSGRQWIYSKRYELILCMATTVISFVVFGEIGIRILGEKDVDGEFFFRDHRLYPYKLPVKKIEAKLKRYRESKAAIVLYDQDIGWVPKPGSSNDLFIFNSAGIRVASAIREYKKVPEKGIFRVLLFGDSYTQGDEVSFEETWGYILEQDLTQRGIRTEILNFGVNAYGMDQAFLRWKKSGVSYSPHLVIFGLQIENAYRNVNIIRPFYNPHTGMPFSKPRFILKDNQLAMINNPVLSPHKLIDLINNIDTWDLVKYETFYDNRDYNVEPWHMSKLVAFGTQIGSKLFDVNKVDDDDRFTTEQSELTYRIIEAFKESVKANGAQFVVVHLPKYKE